MTHKSSPTNTRLVTTTADKHEKPADKIEKNNLQIIQKNQNPFVNVSVDDYAQ